MKRAALMLVFLVGCTTSRGPAPVEDRRPPKPPATKAPIAKAPTAPAPGAVAQDFYTVKRGDTLFGIALEHGQDYRDIAQWNALEDPGKIRVGQALRVTPPPQLAGVPEQPGAPEQPGVQLGTGRVPGRIESRPLEGKVPAAPPVAPAPPAATAPPAAIPPREEPKLEVQPLQFTWPAKGKLLAGFAEPRQKGIDIGGKVGDPVLAAAAGRVTYVGTGIPGLGKLVVIKHDQGFITVYANNKDILVKEQQSVTRGQRIAELGEKLHFQIRKGAAAVDPLLYLPKS